MGVHDAPSPYPSTEWIDPRKGAEDAVSAIVDWSRVRPGRYRHPSGAEVYHASGPNEPLRWGYRLPDGATRNGFEDMSAAMRAAQSHKGPP